MRSRAVTRKKYTKQCAVRAEMLFCTSNHFFFFFLSFFLSFFIYLFIYLSFFFFDVLGCGRSHRYYSSLSGNLQNNKDDGNGNIKTIFNTQTVGFLENPVTADRHSSDEWNTYCILFHLLLWDCSPLHHHSANFVEYNDYHMKTLVLNSWYYLKNNKQKFDDLLNRHFSRQRIDKISQLENVLGEDRFLMYYKFKNYQCE